MRETLRMAKSMVMVNMTTQTVTIMTDSGSVIVQKGKEPQWSTRSSFKENSKMGRSMDRAHRPTWKEI